jgi:hypothetical protein
MDLGEIDRAFEKAIRDEVVKQGYWPDITPFLSTNDITGFEAAKAAIRASGKKLIEVSGVGNYADREELTNNEMIIDRLPATPGRLAAGNIFYEKKDENTYYKLRMPQKTSNIEYNIRMVTNDIAYERLINGIVNKILGRRKVLSGVLDTGVLTENKFRLYYAGELDLSNGEWIEKVYRYIVQDVFLEEPEVLGEVAAMKEIIFDTSPENELGITTENNV